MYARENVSSWDETFIEMAEVVAKRSKDPSTQVGACIVSSENKILSLGYNGAPRGWNDTSFPWSRDSDNPLDTKYPFVIHAERNAVLNFSGIHSQLNGSKIYVTHFPCNECAKEIAQVGISEVIFLNAHDLDSGDLATSASKKIFESCGITVSQITRGSAGTYLDILVNGKSAWS